LGLKELKDLNSLQALDLSSTKVTDAGLKALKKLKSLQTLGLRNTKVTDAGLKELKERKRLQALDLGGTEVSDDKVEARNVEVSRRDANFPQDRLLGSEST
jgi:Leucine-rich repeat (LRR) protein